MKQSSSLWRSFLPRLAPSVLSKSRSAISRTLGASNPTWWKPKAKDHIAATEEAGAAFPSPVPSIRLAKPSPARQSSLQLPYCTAF